MRSTQIFFLFLSFIMIFASLSISRNVTYYASEK